MTKTRGGGNSLPKVYPSDLTSRRNDCRDRTLALAVAFWVVQKPSAKNTQILVRFLCNDLSDLRVQNRVSVWFDSLSEVANCRALQLDHYHIFRPAVLPRNHHAYNRVAFLAELPPLGEHESRL